MHSSEQRYIWATYLVLLALSSLIGDAAILIVSGNRKNFRLNKFLVTIMQHIAVSDISVSIVMILPTAVSLLADAWVLGEALCYAVPYLCAYFYLANMSLICALVAGKFLLLRKPLRARNWSKKHAHLICGIIWMFFVVNPILMYTLGKDDVSFDYRTYICFYGFKSYTWKKIQPYVSFASFTFPNTVIITTTIPTLKYLMEARKSAIRTSFGHIVCQGGSIGSKKLQPMEIQNCHNSQVYDLCVRGASWFCN